MQKLRYISLSSSLLRFFPKYFTIQMRSIFILQQNFFLSLFYFISSTQCILLLLSEPYKIGHYYGNLRVIYHSSLTEQFSYLNRRVCIFSQSIAFFHLIPFISCTDAVYPIQNGIFQLKKNGIFFFSCIYRNQMAIITKQIQQKGTYRIE